MILSSEQNFERIDGSYLLLMARFAEEKDGVKELWNLTVVSRDVQCIQDLYPAVLWRMSRGTDDNSKDWSILFSATYRECTLIGWRSKRQFLWNEGKSGSRQGGRSLLQCPNLLSSAHANFIHRNQLTVYLCPKDYSLDIFHCWFPRLYSKQAIDDRVQGEPIEAYRLQPCSLLIAALISRASITLLVLCCLHLRDNHHQPSSRP
ncbi:hypothetical protein DL98DRAFT_8441 [Cadophora sp. DSE1049]|nr:hypothetical protein DL98DRAFT_8441 [Cadophora sp. DSE1049]